MDVVKFSILGADELIQTIKRVNEDVQFKSGRFALRKGANIVADAMREGASRLDDPETARSIEGNVAVRFNSKAFKRNGDLMFQVGIKHGAVLRKGGAKTANAPTPHWRLLEFGTSKMPAHPFVRPALANNVSRIIAEFKIQFQKSLDRAIKKAKDGI